MAAIPEAVIRKVVAHLPDGVITNEYLNEQFPDWEIEKIEGKTGIHTRHKVAEGETALDIATKAAQKLIDEAGLEPGSVDALLYCTQSPDYLMPTNACLMQDRLGLPTTCMALDYSLGCSGYVYGLALAKGLIAAGQAKRVLLVTADVITRYLAEDDRSVRTLFGDGATATLIEAGDENLAGGHIGKAVYGTDGAGAGNIVVTGGGLASHPLDDRSARRRDEPTLFMDGPEVFAFTLATVPKLMQSIYDEAGIERDDVDWFIFHQANRYMLNHLRRKLRIPEDRFVIEIEDVGNTISSTIPIALSRTLQDNRVHANQKLALVGFGVGLSWGAVIVDWK